MLGQVCSKPVVVVSPDATVEAAARLMRARGVGAVVVANNGRARGILTDRDIAVNVVARGQDPDTTPVARAMTRNPAVIREDRGILDAVRLLATRGVRRLPVVKRNGKLLGMIALDDLLMLLGTEMAHVSSALARELRRPRLVA